MSVKLNVAAFIQNSQVLGPGIRDGLWVQGCSILCPGCFNQDFLPHIDRRLIPVNAFLKYFQTRVDVIDGISILGGEPTEQAEAVSCLLEGIQSFGLNSVVFTGRVYEDLLASDNVSIQRLLKATDLLIDGPYLAEERDKTLHWRGSHNQRLLPLTSKIQDLDVDMNSPITEIVIGENKIVVNGVLPIRF